VNQTDFQPDDEAMITEITIDPDGRVFVFGTSQSVLEVLAKLDPKESRVQTLLNRLQHGRDAISRICDA
jgi:hypothetical protein